LYDINKNTRIQNSLRISLLLRRNPREILAIIWYTDGSFSVCKLCKTAPFVWHLLSASKFYLHTHHYIFISSDPIQYLPLKIPSISKVHSVKQKSIGLKFSKSRTGSDVRYSFHHNSSRFTFSIFVHSWRFSVFHSLQSITPRIYQPNTTIHLLNLKLKH